MRKSVNVISNNKTMSNSKSVNANDGYFQKGGNDQNIRSSWFTNWGFKKSFSKSNNSINLNSSNSRMSRYDVY